MSVDASSSLLYPAFCEDHKIFSLFDLDSKDSGFSEEPCEELTLSSPLSQIDCEVTMCFPIEGVSYPRSTTPTKKNGVVGAKRLFNCIPESPSIIAASSLKRLKIYDNQDREDNDSFDALSLDFSDKILSESSNEGGKIEGGSDGNNGCCRCISIDKKNAMKEAVEKSSNKDLIGDFSREYVLPTISGSHPDLKCISADTMKDVLDGKFRDILESLMIIDSRYPYEYEGGHIRGAINIYSLEECLDLLNKIPTSKKERNILIFHCEFSKERGPSMARCLRKADRSRNAMNYPDLIYPEVYVLEGGYKRFYLCHPQYCSPMEYKEMLHPDHADEMRYFRKKSKSAETVIKTSKKRPPVLRIQSSDRPPIRKSLSADF